jgi:hypothetical protein
MVTGKVAELKMKKAMVVTRALGNGKNASDKSFVKKKLVTKALGNGGKYASD